MPYIGITLMNKRGGASGPIVTLGKPTSVYLTVITAEEIQIDWASWSTNHDGHKIERTAVTGGSSGWTEIFSIASGIVTNLDNTLIGNTTYYYRIRAYKGTNYSDYSDVVSATSYEYWYLSASINPVNCKGAYEPLGAVDLATSYVNKINPGTNNVSAPVAAPTHSNVRGWIFDGSTQYLVTGIVPVNNQTWSMYVVFANHGTGDDTIAGLYESATKTFYLQLKSSTNQLTYANGAIKAVAQVSQSSGKMAVAGIKGYWASAEKTTGIPAGTGNITYDIWIGQTHYSSDSGFFDGDILFLAIYDTVITLTQVTTIDNNTLRKYERVTKSNYIIKEKYLQSQFGALICWTIDSFTNIVPNTPNDNVNNFNPSDLDIDQWLDTCIAAGMKYAVLTVKAEDGFCLWPTAFAVAGYSPYSIGSTSWYAAQGNRDITLEFVTKCRQKGLRVGLYFGVMDNTWEARTGKDETTDAAGYIAMVKAQLYELFTNYGPLDSFWIDSWKMRIDYEEIPFATLFNYMKALQPNCIISDNTHTHPELGCDIEVYEAPAPDGSIPATNTAARLYCEEVVSIRTDDFWYYDSTKDQTSATLRSTAALNAYKAQVIARHGTLLLGITPDTTGHLPAAQVTILEAM